MRALDIQSERFVATGSVASEGVLNQIGRPRFDPLTVLVREAVQNSWDARVDTESGGVHFGIHSWVLEAQSAQSMVNSLLSSTPKGLAIGHLLDQVASGTCRVLAIADTGTVGLGGPTRADVIERAGEPRNFLNLLRNVGQPTRIHYRGGTFGFGKAALFLASTAHTICVHSRCRTGGAAQSRFMMAALGERYQVEDGPLAGVYTGRHWWGRSANNFVEPLLDDEADAAAQALHMPFCSGAATGTTILILAPRLDSENASPPATRLASALLWHCWPKMLPRAGGAPPMTFEVSWDGESVEVPDPRRHSTLAAFVRAFDSIQDSSKRSGGALSQVSEIRCERPRKPLGTLALEKFFRAPSTAAVAGIDDTSPIALPCHHVALLRRPELVVRYQAGQIPASSLEYAGVFLVDSAVDEIFSKSEPPTHDDWVAQALEDHERTFVRVALRKINEVSRAFVEAAQSTGHAVEQRPLGLLANYLGDLLSEAGPGASIPLEPEAPGSGSVEEPGQRRGDEARPGGTTGTGPSGDSGGRGPDASEQPGTAEQSRARVVAGEGELVETDGGLELHVPMTVRAASNAAGTIITAKVAAVLDGDVREVEPPLGAAVPAALYWADEAGEKIALGAEVIVAASANTHLTLVVSVPDDVLVDVSLSASTVRQ